MPRIILGIPCYNCSPQVLRLIDEIESLPELMNKVHKIVFIDNGSHDLTRENIKTRLEKSSLKAISCLVENELNYGLGGTHKICFEIAVKENFDFLAILHGDHQAQFKDLDLLLGEMDSDPGYDAILGARFLKESQRVGYSKLRIIGNMGLNKIFSLCYKINIQDIGSGLNLFKVTSYPRERLEFYDENFNFNIDLLIDTLERNLKFKYVPIKWSEVDQISNASNVRVGMKTLFSLMKKKMGISNTKRVWRYSYRTIYFRE